MAALLVSLAVVGAVVLLCELSRRAAARYLPGAYWIYALEFVCTLQLCWCANELKLLGERSELPLSVRLTLLYVVTVVHLVSFRGASCSFIWPLERACRRKLRFKAAAGVASCQLAAALAAQALAVLAWSQGWSDIHVRHQRFGYKCFDPLGGTLLEAAAVELICSFIVQAVVLHLHKLEPLLRVHALSAVITVLVYAGEFPCSGHSYLEYMFVYWLGPMLGAISCNLLFEIILPFLCGRSSITGETKKQKSQ
uniref:Uncharacterized protein n=1 Tax=Periophthalmus magnuspinnatus TaxID=409849 RepID=A0A3B3ZX04_9GOBI